MMTISGQVYAFFCCILSGFVIGTLFDSFRMIRRFIKTKDAITYVEDIIFWLLVGGIILFTFYQTNNGQIRGYLFLGMIIGTVLYFLILSRYILKSLTFVIKKIITMVSFINRIIFEPMNKMKNLLIKISKAVIVKAKFLFLKIYSKCQELIQKLRIEKKLQEKS